MCADHWAALRGAIEARGLAELVAATGEEAARRMQAEAHEGRTIDNFDPLMGAHMAILTNALSARGVDIMLPNEDGTERCPLCFLTLDHAAGCRDPDCRVGSFDKWIERAADDQLAAWRAMQL